MSSEMKTALKEARNFLRQRRYLDAMEHCKTILKAEKHNYMALVILAAALLEMDEYKAETPLVLKQAIDLQPDNPLAWQGIVSFYEKEPETVVTWNWLVPAYCKLLHHESELPKFKHYVSESSGLAIRLNNIAIIETVVGTLTKLRDEVTDERKEFVEKALLGLLASDRQEYLCRKQKFHVLLSAALRMYESYPKDASLLKWICRVYAEQTILGGSCDGVEIDEIQKALFILEPSSHLAAFAKGVELWRHNNFIESRDVLNEVVTLSPGRLHAWILLSEINLKLYCWSAAENAALRALECLDDRDTELQDRIDLVLVEAMAKSSNEKKWAQAARGCEVLLEKKETKIVKLLLARTYVLLKDSRSEVLLAELEDDEETRTEATILRALALKNQKNYEESLDVLGSALETSEAWAMLGEINWLLGEYGHSMMAFLKGIHAQPNNWHCLVYLGHYYRERVNDLEKSRKCYQKALRINPNADEAGFGLSTAFRLLKNTEANMEMLLNMTTADGGGPKWAWLQLGLQQLDQGEVGQAIKSLRYVIRADPNDNHCWESLADAYLARGAHTSALKSYERALELSPGSVYPMIQLANIKLALGQHDEAMEDFSKVLIQDRRYIPALKGLAETSLGLARNNCRQQLLGRARRNAQQAADSLTEAIIENGSLSCMWKLLGDACYRVAVLPNKYSYLNVTPGLVKSESEGERIVVRKSELFVLASRCYCRALNLTKDTALLWHDLACCYLSQLRSDPSVNRADAAKKSLAAAKQAVKLCPSSWVHWNILGAVCITEEVKNYALAQHCWVMAIDREPNNTIAWTNLGTLYLKLGDLYKANEAFSRAQRADPEYGNSWIGQSMIAEVLDKKEATDLFRHSISLGYHSQAAMGYAHWVLTTLLDPKSKEDPLYTYTIVNMHAVAVATDAMTWYTEQMPDDACGRNCFGLLLERSELYNRASEQFVEALNLEKEEANRDSVRINLARVLVQLGRFNEAIETCKTIKSASFKSHAQLALALYKANRFEESYDAYEATLNWLADAGSDKAHVLCAMAAMAYVFLEIDDVKTLLFQCIEIEPPTVAGLVVAAALGLLHNDVNLTDLVLRELEAYKDDSDHRHHVAVLTAYSRLVHQDIDGAIRVLSKAVHRHPDDVNCWVGLVKILLQTQSRTFAHCAQKTLFLGRKSSTVGVSQVACISSLGDLTDEANNDGDRLDSDRRSNKHCPIRGLRSVQKTVFSFPGDIESWANLIAALLPRDEVTETRPNAAWVARLISKVRGQFRITKPMDEWLTKNMEEAERIAVCMRSRSTANSTITLTT